MAVAWHTREWRPTSEIRAMLGLTKSRRVRKHLDTLEAAGVLERAIRGDVTLWRLAPPYAEAMSRRAKR